jgi:uncharacterized protein YfdQ (DUF2303 family)
MNINPAIRSTGGSTDGSTGGDMQALIHTLQAHGAPRANPDTDGKHYTVVPADFMLHELPTLKLPARPIGTVKLRDAASFAAYFNEHKAPRSRIYATLEPAQFLAVFDDFDPGSGNNDVASQSDWREFRAQFKVPPSREWQTWTARDRKPMSQLEFAEFLQDNLPDVLRPSGAALLEMSLNFEATQEGSFVAAQRLQDGSHNLVWRAENNAGGSVKLPDFIDLTIPVFEKETPKELSARLRYRVASGKLTIWYELVRPHKVLEAAFDEAWQRIAAETQTPIFLGSPE